MQSCVEVIPSRLSGYEKDALFRDDGLAFDHAVFRCEVLSVEKNLPLAVR